MEKFRPYLNWLFVVFAVIGAATLAQLTINKHHELKIRQTQIMSEDIKTALSKGIDPIVVRCAYASETDQVCLIRAASRNAEQHVELRTPAN